MNYIDLIKNNPWHILYNIFLQKIVNVGNKMCSMQLVADSKIHVQNNSFSDSERIFYHGVRQQQSLPEWEVRNKFWGGQNDVICGIR